MDLDRLTILPTRHGSATGRSNERQMVAQICPDEIRTAMMIHADGSVTRVKTRKGFVEYITEKAATLIRKYARGFGAVIHAVSLADVVTLVSWKFGWKRVSQETVYWRTINYASVKGHAGDAVVAAKTHIDERYHDVAVISSPSGAAGRVLSINTQKIADLPPAMQDGCPFIIPVVTGAENFYSSEPPGDVSCYHVFSITYDRVEHFRGGDAEISEQYETSGGAPMPPLASSVGQSFSVSPFEKMVTFRQVAYTDNSNGFLNIYYRHAAAQLGGTLPYITGTSPAVTTRQYSVFIDVDGGALRSETLTPSWERSFSVPNLHVFDYFTSRNEPAASGVPGAFDRYIDYAGSVLAPSAEDPARCSTQTRTFIYNTGTSDNYPIGGGQTLNVSVSVMVNYIAYVSTGELRQKAVGGADIEVINVPRGTFGAGVATRPSAAMMSGRLLQTTASGQTRTYTNVSTTTVTHAVGEKTLFDFTAHLNFQDEAVSGYAATGRGEYGRGLADGALLNEGTTSTDTPQVAFYAVGYALFSSDPDAIRYAATSASATGDSGALIYADKTKHTYTMHRETLATCRDYIFADDVNQVYAYVEGSFSATNVDTSYAGNSTLRVDFVVEFNGSEQRVTLCDLSQGRGFNAAVYRSTFITFASYDPSHTPPPSMPSLYIPKCEQGDFKYISYSTVDEHADGLPPRLLLSLPLYLEKMDQQEPYPAGADRAHKFIPFNLYGCSKLFGYGVFYALTPNVFHINMSHDFNGNWLAQLGASTDKSSYYAECYRT